MHTPQSLKFSDFESANFVTSSQHGQYLINYLKGLEVKKILVEPNYFDRDYLSEFSAFYSTSAYGYKNICQRVHFFSSKAIDRKLFIKATGGDKGSINVLNDHYLGFCVLRPIPAKLGKTVLKWYKNREKNSNRITVQRTYKCHVAGVELNIKGLAWQQQDAGVGACATIALWSALQSSAFDDFHAIPTTAEITKAAHKTASLGERTFPSKGLNYIQLYEAIKQLGLSPLVQTGSSVLNNQKGLFTKEQFISSIASYIRSGYPVIILGQLKTGDKNIGLHAVCVVGFRESFFTSKKSDASQSSITLADSGSEVLYIHDDNIGPNARFKVKTEKLKNGTNYPVLHLEAPQYNCFKPNIESNNYQIIPNTLVVAVHNELKASPDQLYSIGFKVANPLFYILKKHSIPLSFSTRFIKLTDYVHNELGRLLAGNPELLSQLRLHLWEKVRPMSLHLGLVRIGFEQSSIPLVDVLYDTTDSNLQLFTHVPYYKMGR